MSSSSCNNDCIKLISLVSVNDCHKRLTDIQIILEGAYEADFTTDDVSINTQ